MFVNFKITTMIIIILRFVGEFALLGVVLIPKLSSPSKKKST